MEFFAQYEETNFGECSIERLRELRNYIHWTNNSVHVMDGVYDTYEFDGYLFMEMWTTNNGCLMLSALKIPDEHIDDWQGCDFLCNDSFQEVYIRLD